MDSRSESRNGKDGDGATSQSKPTSAAKRPLTKPVGPRLSNLSRPTSASSARTTSATSTLNKPPSRPISSARRQTPSVTSVATTVDGVSKRLSVSSVEGKTSGDEVKRESITAKPKRMSLASSTTSERTTSARSAVPSTPSRIGGSAVATTRHSVTSTTSSRNVPSSSTSRPTAAATARSRPLSTSSSRNITSLADRKRLSTIPASPAVKVGTEESEDNKENEQGNTAGLSGSEWTQDEGDGLTKSNVNSQQSKSHLQAELEQSRQQIVVLEEQIAEMTTKIDQLDQSAGDTTHNQSESQAIRHEYEARIEQINVAHDEALQIAQDELAHLKQEMKQSSNKDDGGSSRRVVELEQELESTRENTRRTLSELKTETQSRFGEIEARYTDQINELAAKLAEADSGLVSKQAEISEMSDKHTKSLGKINDEVARQSQVITTLQGQISIFQQSKDDKANDQSSLITKLQTSIADLEQSKAKDLQATASELDAVKLSHVTELENLKSQLDTAHETIRADSNAAEAKESINLRELEARLSQAQAELKSMKSSHSAELDRLQTDLQTNEQESRKQRDSASQDLAALKTEIEAHQAVHQKAMEEAQKQKDSHNLRVAELDDLLRDSEQRSRSALNDLTGLKESHANSLKKIQSETTAAHQDNLEKITLSYSTEVKELKRQLHSANESLDNLKVSHEKALSDAHERSQHEQKAVRDELNQVHVQQIQKLETNVAELQREVKDRKEDHATDTEDLKAQLEKGFQDKVKQLESKSRSLNSDLENAKFQVDSMKGILASVEEEASRKEHEHRATVDNLQIELESAKSKTAQQTAQIDSLQKQHDTALTNARSVIENKHKETLDKNKNDLDTAMANLRDTLAKEHKSAMEEIQRGHLAEFNKQRTEHESMVASWEQSSKKKLQDLQNALEEQKAHREGFEKAFARNLADTNAKHQNEMEKLKTGHTTDRQTLEDQILAGQRALKEQDQSQTVKSLQDKISQTEATHMATVRTHVEALKGVKEGHAIEVAKLHAELEDLKSTSGGRGKSEEAEKVVHDLKTPSITSQAELNVQKSPAGAASLTAGQSTTLTKESSTPANILKEAGNGTTTSAARKPGLASSKWAIPEDKGDVASSPLTPRTPLSATAAAFNPIQTTIQQSASSSPTSVAVSTPHQILSSGPKSPISSTSAANIQHQSSSVVAEKVISPTIKKSNAQAQLASIQEQLRQLNDISGDFLEEHELLAKTLHRHSDVLDNQAQDEKWQMVDASKASPSKQNGVSRSHDGESVGDGDSQGGLVEVIEDEN